MGVISSTAYNVSPLFIQPSEMREWLMDLVTHSFNTAITAADISAILGKSEHDILKSFLGGLLHDTGKLNIDHKILNANRPLTIKEKQQVSMHSTFGYLFLENIYNKDCLKDVIKIIKHHHDYDKECTDLEMIVQVADVFAALTETRPYRERFSKKEALCIIEKEISVDDSIIKALKSLCSGYHDE